MKLSTLILLLLLLLNNQCYSQNQECNWFYKLNDNGFDETTRSVTSIGDSPYYPKIELLNWPNDAKYKNQYGMQFTWVLGDYPEFLGGDLNKIYASVKVNGVYKKYTFSTRFSKGPSLIVLGGVNLDFLNDLKIGSELNIVVNLGQPLYQSKVYRYELNCSSSCINKLIAP